MTSVAATIPPELLKKIIDFVGNEILLSGYDGGHMDYAARRAEMQHLSVCSLTCVYWARITRRKMFSTIVLRSLQDIRDLNALFSTSSAVLDIRRIPSLLDCLVRWVVDYQLGEYLWFLKLQPLLRIQEEYRLYASSDSNIALSQPSLDIHVSDRRPPSTNKTHFRYQSARHPLFYAMPRPIPLLRFRSGIIRLFLEDIHFANLRELRNLVGDFNLDRWDTKQIFCRRITWGDSTRLQPSSFASLSTSVESRFSYNSGPSVIAYQCTDNVLATLNCSTKALAGAFRWVSQLCIQDYDHLLDIVQGLYDNINVDGRNNIFGRCEVIFVGKRHYKKPGERHWMLGLNTDENEDATTAEFDFSIQALPSEGQFYPTTIGVEKIHFAAISHPIDERGQERADIHKVRIDLQHRPTPFGSPVEVAKWYDWDTLIKALRQFPMLSRITIWCQERDFLVTFATQLMETLLAAEDILTLAYGPSINFRHQTTHLRDL
ncbi:hypothetical protein BDY19DRAFT_95016 [Irpex rosettiformis]|uniref:Uncharacterized protein n=1 Tax=Irpex rosettiformis TaxID=378272 RepID=A0ACB8U6M6_9APHY|nr:hypothetical protein BDY19DRAFT_95016 [Irpex rosettiformis]